MASQITDLYNLLKGLQEAWTSSKHSVKNIYQLLKNAANGIMVDDFIRFDQSYSHELLANTVCVFHYGILVYDNYSLSNDDTLIPFKHVYSKEKQKVLSGLASAAGKSDSTVRDLLYKNQTNADIVSQLGYDDYLLFSHDLGKDTTWNVMTNTGQTIKLDNDTELWGSDMGVLNIFKDCIFTCSGLESGTIYTAIKVIDVDIQGSSSSYLIVNSEDKNLIGDFIMNRECQNRINLLVGAVRSLYTQIHSDEQRIESIKSAKAAIMSRNISHNLGSHVMAYMKHDLSSVEDMLKKEVLRNALLPDDADTVKGKEIPYLVGVGKFLSYLQERQDYIATVSTDYIPYKSIVNFKDAIYDELNPDYRFRRHYNEWTGHQPANILLQNIAKSEGLSRKTILKEDPPQDENNIIIKYGAFDGLNTEVKDYEQLRRWNFSLPGGIMGRQAIFSIVENVIRNAAKHSTRQNGENLIITFDIIDPMESDFNDSDYNNKQDIQDLYIVKLTTNTIIDEDGLKKIKSAIDDDLIELNGQLKQSNKGIKEMKISAAWLRGIKIEEYKDEQIQKKAKILKALRTDKGELQYIFCLPKVKELAIITQRIKEDELSSPVLKLMKAKGWYIFNDVDTYLRYPNRDFSFVIIDPALCTSVQKNDDGLNPENVTENDTKKQEIDTKERIKRRSHNRYFVATEGNTNHYAHLIKTDLINNFPKKKENEDEKVIEKEAKKFFDDTILGLYAELANFQPGDEIAIADKDLTGEHEHSEKARPFDDAADNVLDFKFIYRKHNDTVTQFNQLVEAYGRKKFFNPSILRFVEGITGGNSTDRLVRHMDWDDLWVYKQLHAMKTRVAIFDERIFTKVTGLETKDLTLTQTQTNNWNFKDCEGDVEKAKNAVYNYDFERNNPKRISDSLFDEWEGLQSMEAVQAFADKYFPRPSSATGTVDSVNSMVFHMKGIDVFTITGTEEGIFQIWGFVPDEGPEADYGKVKAIGQLTIDPQGFLDPEFTEAELDGYAIPQYTYLSIHQGLLDKVYDIFKENKEKDIMKIMKRKVSKVLYNKFITSCNDDDYLQGLLIHSGRSKPNNENMPQHQPFVQYSALENATLDCKYTLVELLDFACFE